uniref:Acetyl-coenzyme A carboxylase carboxyl transferase subunit alpha n=1 Tax=Hildenbrandia rivularis TaxID=135206 RepID=A0A1C9CFJ5_9FLOR|nr:acetyl-CoA carboxylase carboxyltransferase alpha subunit [Hildenbrandia rivularis]AOM67127.1 acetyl-CoA carboxylase carboxyltransferase alpha subunit [Hildenbrandia rivularis]
MINDKQTTLSDILKPVIHLELQAQKLHGLINKNNTTLLKKLNNITQKIQTIKREILSGLNPLQRIHLVRQAHRPTTLDYIKYMMDEYIELHGDRAGSDDSALVGGIGRLNNRTVIFLGHQRGKNTKDNVARNFGMPSPGGYRKALRLMQHASRFNLPIITFIDTPGAWAGIEAEKFGQGEAIAVNLREMFGFRVPIVCTIIGEGGSGGALGIGIGDVVLMLEHAVYTVATPEACAAILWKDSKQSPKAAEALKITSQDLYNLGVIDKIVPEPHGGSQDNPEEAAKTLKSYLYKEINNLLNLNKNKREQYRYERFRRLGTCYED